MGFRQRLYRLDEKILNFPLTQERAADAKVEEIETTIGEICKSLPDRRVEIDEYLVGVRITTATETLVFKGRAFVVQVLVEYLKLRNEGPGWLNAMWFWYDDESVFHRFFVVHGDKIVYESVELRDDDLPEHWREVRKVSSLFHSSSLWRTVWSDLRFSRNIGVSGFSLLDFPSSWLSARALRKAKERFWYRKFYTETPTGQFMVVRKPELSGRWGLDTTADLLRKIYILLWVLIALVSFVLIRLYR